jgi:hypothetical protein
MNKMISFEPNSVALAAHQNVGSRVNITVITALSRADNLPDAISGNNQSKHGIDPQVEARVNGDHVSDTPLAPHVGGQRSKTAEVIDPSGDATQADVTEHPSTVGDAQSEEVNVPELASQSVSVIDPVNLFNVHMSFSGRRYGNPSWRL